MRQPENVDQSDYLQSIGPAASKTEEQLIATSLCDQVDEWLRDSPANPGYLTSYHYETPRAWYDTQRPTIENRLAKDLPSLNFDHRNADIQSIVNLHATVHTDKQHPDHDAVEIYLKGTGKQLDDFRLSAAALKSRLQVNQDASLLVGALLKKQYYLDRFHVAKPYAPLFRQNILAAIQRAAHIDQLFATGQLVDESVRDQYTEAA